MRRKQRHWLLEEILYWTWPAIILGLFVFCIGCAIWGAWWNYAHPCIRYEPSTCSACAHEVQLPDTDGMPGPSMCVSCNVCVERAP